MAAENLVPKVHPPTRTIEPDDPLELVATLAHGDPEVMLECMVQEFAWMGCGVTELMGLFRSPTYPVLNQLLTHFGEDDVRRRVEAIVGHLGVFRVQETIIEEPAPEDEYEPALIELTVRKVSS